MLQHELTTAEFDLFRSFIYEHAGINLGNDKKPLIVSRLSKRLRHYSLTSFQQYFELIQGSPPEGERQTAIDLLTTNETYFFREPKHFNFLQTQILSNWQTRKTFRVWSAASSTGEEAYSIAMLLDDLLADKPWQIFGSDISRRVLKTAKQGHFQLQRIEGIPRDYLTKYCLKGKDEQRGTMLVVKKLRERLEFAPINLTKPIPDIGKFEVIFLRNVLIYFDVKTKAQIIKQLVRKLQPEGYLFVGHSESLKEITNELASVAPSVYQKNKAIS